jgi:hypothetical protein
MKFWFKGTLPPPKIFSKKKILEKKMSFLKKFLTFLAKKCHFFRIFFGPLGIIKNLQENFQNIL